VDEVAIAGEVLRVAFAEVQDASPEW
jgi:hypothetical protein